MKYPPAQPPDSKSSPFSFKKPQPLPSEVRRPSKEENEYFAEREDQRVYAK